MTSCRKVEQALTVAQEQVSRALSSSALESHKQGLLHSEKVVRKRRRILKWLSSCSILTVSHFWPNLSVCICLGGDIYYVYLFPDTLTLAIFQAHSTPTLLIHFLPALRSSSFWRSSVGSSSPNLLTQCWGTEERWGALVPAGASRAVTWQCVTQTFSLSKYTRKFQILSSFWSLNTTLPPACILLVMELIWFVF